MIKMPINIFGLIKRSVIFGSDQNLHTQETILGLHSPYVCLYFWFTALTYKNAIMFYQSHYCIVVVLPILPQQPNGTWSQVDGLVWTKGLHRCFGQNKITSIYSQSPAPLNRKNICRTCTPRGRYLVVILESCLLYEF